MRALTGAAAAAMAGILAALIAGAVWVATLNTEPQGRPTIPGTEVPAPPVPVTVVPA